MQRIKWEPQAAAKVLKQNCTPTELGHVLDVAHRRQEKSSERKLEINGVGVEGAATTHFDLSNTLRKRKMKTPPRLDQ